MTGSPDPRRRPLDRAWRRWRHRGLVVESMALLTLGAALQKWVPMTRWSSLLGQVGPVPEEWHGESVAWLPVRAADVVERRVALAIRSGNRWLPFHASCLAEATAGQVMLRQFHRPGVVVIGLRVTEQPPWDAHAWLLGSRGALTGGPAARGFTATTVFELPAGVRAEGVDLSVS